MAWRKRTSLYFCTWKICFPSQEAIICSFTFTDACLWVGQILLKLSMAKRTLFPPVWRERQRANSRLWCRYITLVSITCSSSLLLPILPFGVPAWTCVLFFRQPSRNSSMHSVCSVKSLYFIILFVYIVCRYSLSIIVHLYISSFIYLLNYYEIHFLYFYAISNKY